MEIIGRTEEQAALDEYVHSDESEFVAIYGRRRVGKTFLIKKFFKENFTFFITGLAKANMNKQLETFNIAINKYGSDKYPPVATWLRAFEQLTMLIEKAPANNKKVIFIDEMPWLDTHKSGFITALEYFWNGFASTRSDVLLIACGSATSWMINKLIRNHGGLHNRVTRTMLLSPFTLAECETYYRAKGIVMNQYQMIEAYMILGGIPHYLKQMDKKLSLAQNIDKLCFAVNAPLKNEYNDLFASLFKAPEPYMKIIGALAQKTKGLTREEMIELAGVQDGGSLTRVLSELELSGFIRKYHAIGKTERNRLYQLIDFYSLFYLNFIRESDGHDEHFWTRYINTPGHGSWSGYAFEQVCMQHTGQIKSTLGISGIMADIASWRSRDQVSGAQIDMLIDRSDNTINLCEIKYANEEYCIDKEEDRKLRNRKEAFIRETKTKKSIHYTMITTYGLKKNAYSDIIQSEITMEDLFK